MGQIKNQIVIKNSIIFKRNKYSNINKQDIMTNKYNIYHII